MGWSSLAYLELTNDWQFTEPIESPYIRIKSFFSSQNRTKQNRGLLAQASISTDWKVTLTEAKIIYSDEKNWTLYHCPKPSPFLDNRIALKDISGFLSSTKWFLLIEKYEDLWLPI